MWKEYEKRKREEREAKLLEVQKAEIAAAIKESDQS